MASNPFRRAVCPGCDRDIALKKDGTLRHHQQWTGGPMLSPPHCEWSGLNPFLLAELPAPTDEERSNG